MNKKISIWKKIKEFMSWEKETQQFKKLKKTAYQINPQKVRQVTFISNLCVLFIIVITMIVLNIIEKNMDINYQSLFSITIIGLFVALFVICAFGLLIAANYILFNKIIEINNKEIQHNKENIEY